MQRFFSASNLTQRYEILFEIVLWFGTNKNWGNRIQQMNKWMEIPSSLIILTDYKSHYEGLNKYSNIPTNY